MIRYGFLRSFFFICAAFSILSVESASPGLLRDLSTLIAPCSTRELVEVLPRNIEVYFNDRYPDGSYIFGYILNSGERRYERATRYAGILYVEGFYSVRKISNSRYIYETTRYTAGKDGYYPRRVEITYTPPKMPTVDYYRRETNKEIVNQL